MIRKKSNQNLWLEENAGRYHGFDSSKSFVEQLWGMPYLERCIVLGIVMGEPEREIVTVLNSGISRQDFDFLMEQKGLKTWEFARAILDN